MMHYSLVTDFLDLLAFLLLGATGAGTAFVVWFESRLFQTKMTEEQFAIFLRSTAIGSLFLWAFFRSFIDPLDNEVLLWGLRLFLLFSASKYLRVLVRGFRRRHGYSLWYAIRHPKQSRERERARAT